MIRLLSILFLFFYAIQAKVICETTKGEIIIEIFPNWSPLGVERFLLLVDEGFFQNIPLFRCVDDFLCQFGYNYNKKVQKFEQTFKDDIPLKKEELKFKRGYISFAGNGKNSRSCHLFITLGENVESLGTEPWETPIGYVTEESMNNVVSKFTTKYGDMAPWGDGPNPQLIESPKGGLKYLKTKFPELDYIISCKRIENELEKDLL